MHDVLGAAFGGSMIGWKPKTADARIASVRIRCLNPLRELAARGVSVELFHANHAHRYDAVVYSKLYDDASYREATALKQQGVQIVLDLCDNHFYNPSDSPTLRRVGVELRRMIALADHVVASTPAMADAIQAELAAPRPITVIGDAVEDHHIDMYEPWFTRWGARRALRRVRGWIASRRNEGRTNLVWFGIHGGPQAEHGMLDLERVRPYLEALDRTHPLSLTIISNSREKYQRTIAPWAIPTAYVEWNVMTFRDVLRAHHIAVIPVTPNPFTRCKSNNRLVTALSAGLAVVADAIPSYEPFGDICWLDDWETGLGEYLADPGVRARDVEAGQARVVREWSLPRIADDWQRFFGTLRRQRTGGSVD